MIPKFGRDPELRYKVGLARELGMTLGELGVRMSSRELTLQHAYDALLADEASHAEAAAEVRQVVRQV